MGSAGILFYGSSNLRPVEGQIYWTATPMTLNWNADSEPAQPACDATRCAVLSATLYV